MIVMLTGIIGPLSSIPQANANLPAPFSSPESPVRLGQTSELMASQLRAPFYEGSLRGSRFVTTTSGITTTVGLATTYSGLVLINPVGSGVNAIVEKLYLTFTVAFAAAAVLGVLSGYNASVTQPHTVGVTPAPSKLGSAAVSSIFAATASVLNTTPALFAAVSGFGSAAITAVLEMPEIVVNFDGALIIPPGGFAGVYTSTAGGAAGLAATFIHEELATVPGT